VTDLVAAGAGMAGLAAAARARELGAEVDVYEKGARVGGSMLLSSGVIWRYAEWEEFRRQCPGGDEALQQAVHEGVDEGIEWLRSLGAVVTDETTGNPLTAGKRFDTRELCIALLRTGPSLRIGSPLEELPDGVPVVLATGGFQADPGLVREWITPQADGLFLRSNSGNRGDGLRMGLAAGGQLSAGMGEFYGRAMPAVAALPESDWVPAVQLYARWASSIEGSDGALYDGEVDWAEVNVAQWIAQRPGARAWFVVPESALGERARYGTVAEMIERARGLGARVELRDKGTAVEVVAAITQTLGGLRTDSNGRVVPGVWAAGGDTGGVSTGGYMSNLAAALVMGRRAAEDALSDSLVS
jgi:succinate dehydrogenase/fumarate reductase flavoprotein subunit